MRKDKERSKIFCAWCDEEITPEEMEDAVEDPDLIGSGYYHQSCVKDAEEALFE